MLNHIYGIIGIMGTLVTIATSYIRNQDWSQWLLVCSGWLAALMVGWFTHRTINALSNNHKDVIISNDGVKQKLIDKNRVLTEQLAHAIEQKEKIEGIAAYLANQNPQIDAMPRAIARQEHTEPGGS
ncbi:protein gop [Serratia marcescens]|uniref:Protein gop n=1 Tax=Serratia marcescens TaxID=615 RepID=A0ABX5NK39_SERMA|nr:MULTISPECIES: protein gop [Serratia]KXJ01010.1 protein gop [Serratia marcescens]MBX9282913.1 protein gop [Serratia marcescens]MBX9288126.1 protein gop [Serratia marcescens]MBX9292767.1 protein gop [Serratia marcescens]MBX9301859.1 protein gop [Serratia marcescens]